MALTKVSTDGFKDDAVTTDKLADAINTERTANTAKTSTTINNNADNRLITGSGTANTLEGESSLTYSASGDLTQTVTVDGKGIVLNAGNVKPMIVGDSNRLGTGNTILGISGKWNGTEVARIAVEAGSDATNKDDGTLNFFTTPSGGSLTKRMDINTSGMVSILTNGLNLENATASNSRVFRITNASGSTGWTFGNGVIADAHQFVIYDNSAGAGRMLIDGNGVARFNNGIQLGNGLTNSTAHQLDDYEEGTWTPTLASGTATSYLTQWYVKIGTLVTCYFYQYAHSDTSSSTHYKISGLPFAHATNKESFFHLSTNANGNFGSGVISVNGRIGVTGTTTQISFYRSLATSTPNLTHSDVGNAHLAATFSYHTV